eukprot:Nitzschia sp. Nitz4//scaffold53_size117307//369//2626//NITZ4_003750-RA/size117307-augustus-gene-0.89-mRNA-1//1//CDS//3329554145//5976//frame0
MGELQNKRTTTLLSNSIPTNPDRIAANEDNAVNTTRRFVAFFLTACTISVACMVFFITKSYEQRLFEEDVRDFAAKTMTSIGSNLDHAIASVDSFAVSVVSNAKYANQTWPFVYIPDLGAKVARVLSTTKCTSMSMFTIVTEEQREEWDAFSLEMGPVWVEENLKVQKSDWRFQGTQLDNYTVAPMWNFGGGLENVSTHYVTWQTYPTASTIFYPFNYDVALDLPEEAINTLESGRFRLSDIANHPEGGASYINWLGDFVSDDFPIGEPVSEVFYPLLSNAAEKAVVQAPGTTSMQSNTTELHGFLWSPFFWRHELLDILPPGTKPLVVVIANTCNKSFTYEVEGPDVNFLGYGDYHNNKFDNLVLESTLQSLPVFRNGDMVYSGVPMMEDERECQYSFNVYPSNAFEEEYITHQPLIFALVTVAIFLFTSAVFAAYDIIVEKRQDKVLSTAVKSSAIVSSLFPSNVRGRLYETDLTTSENERPPQYFGHLSNFLRNQKLKQKEGDDSMASASAPIADLFPHTTVLFADIAGFTNWSSSREPSQVFTLLESLYGEFDAIATANDIFKVETIGDCYVAVAGLPDPRPDHAVVMTKFANDCHSQMATLMAQLALELGPDTEFLSMRFGLNSGPVTAGVLRGQKSRFQLFGDTVNTASRMETTGQKEKIHVSQATADELIKQGKQDWLKARDNRVEVKGKGQLQTYWVTIPTAESPIDTATVQESEHAGGC